MKYFVSWTHSDPVYQQYLPGVRALVSPPNVSQTWQAGDWPCPPEELIVDSGAFQHHRAGRGPSPEEALRQQLRIVEGLGAPAHLDGLRAAQRAGGTTPHEGIIRGVEPPQRLVLVVPIVPQHGEDAGQVLEDGRVGDELDRYPQLKLLAWSRHTPTVTGREALALYERNWRHVDQGRLEAHERALLSALTKAYGHGALLV